jgi:hypothetical protein
MWRALSLMAPSFMASYSGEYHNPLSNPPPYPFSVKPEYKLTPHDLIVTIQNKLEFLKYLYNIFN